MPGKLCPVDKQPCIGEQCAIYNEELRLCAWAITGGAEKRPDRERERTAEYEAMKKTHKEKSERHRVHLFD